MSIPDDKRLGLIGLGSFGQFAARHLRDHFEVVAADRIDCSEAAHRLGVGWTSVEDAAASPYVVLTVPVQRLTQTLHSIRDYLPAGAVVIDAASVKSLPIGEMLRVLPDTVDVLGTHPMFGPQSAEAGLRGHRIVLCPGRGERLESARSFLERLGLDVYVCDADTHDREIAHTQVLAQFVGRALSLLQESESPVRTPGYNQFREVAETVGEDSWELFTAIQNLNPHAARTRDEFLAHLNYLQDRLAQEEGAARATTEDGTEARVPGDGAPGNGAPEEGASAKPPAEQSRPLEAALESDD